MQNRIVLVSDDTDFFEYILPRLNLRKSDELYRFCFKDIPNKLDSVLSSMIIINSEGAFNSTLELLDLIKGTPSVVFAYNEDEAFRIQAFNAGCFAYITMLTPDNEFQAKIKYGLSILNSLKKQNRYRDILVEKGLITLNNEVYLDYNKILEKEIEKVNKNAGSSVLIAISPNEKTKFLLQANQIETFILTGIRQNDILMNFAPNKYFLLLNDTNIPYAEKIWAKIEKTMPEKIYAGFALVQNRTREQVVNEALNKLHEAINRDFSLPEQKHTSFEAVGNFKIFRKEFNKNLEKIITPVFYHTQQKYGNKLFEMSVNNKFENGVGVLNLKSKYTEGILKITSPGCTKINIDVEYKSNRNVVLKTLPAHKRITFEPNELEAGLLEDLIEQFISEFKREVDNEHT